MFYSPRPWPRSGHHVGLMVTMGDQCVIQVKGQYIPTENFLSQSAGRDYFSEKVALFCIDLEASRGVKIWRGITTFILHFNWF